MAKYTVKHNCGHEHEYLLFGKHSDRESRLEWLATQDCPECKRAAKEKKNAEAITGSPFAVVENTVLKGTEKQVAWANRIRREFLVELTGEKRVNPAAIPAIAKFFAQKTSAKFWIEKVHGYLDCFRVVVGYRKEIKAIFDAQNA